MLLPCIVWFVIFSYIPMVGLVLAFKEFKYNMGMLRSPWVGLHYFKAFFSYYQSTHLILNTFWVGFIKIILTFPFPIIFALMLNEVRNNHFKRIAQTISYLPHFLSWVVVASLVQKLLAPNEGLINQLYASLGGDGSTFWLMEEDYFYQIMFMSNLWKSLGWGSIIYLAAIAGIDPTLYEAAEVDGAGWFWKIIYVTISGIRSTIGILFILNLGEILRTGFEQNFLLRTPGNMNAADILDVYVLRTGLMQGQFGYATAIGMLQGLAGLGMVVLANRLARKFTEVSLW
ncbi:MAG: sugar ABC transporter permease [Spirochaetales bacterium]|jgi:putative aldouronate transport system permease protein|nr:sugar ABC transporter permease [Spirochaetales bacterium]